MHPAPQNSRRYLLENGIRDVDFLDVETQDAALLQEYDLIFIMGGNSNHLFYHLRKSGADRYITAHIGAGRDVVAASAGAWFLSAGRQYADECSAWVGIDETYPENVDNTGLGVIDVHLFPHYDMFAERADGLEAKLSQLEDKEGIRILRLKNADFIYRDNDGKLHSVIT